MKVILLAAGRGTRISSEISGVPKCTLDIGGGESLIEHTVKLFQRNNIPTAIVVGYQRQRILDQIGGNHLSVYLNPFYDVTNSIASLWFARDYWSDGDVVLMNADVYIEQDTVDLLVNEERCPMMLVDSSRTLVGDYFFSYEDDILKKYGKELPLDSRTGEYIGIAKLRNGFRGTFMKQLDRMLDAQRHGAWWEEVLYTLSEEGVPIYVRDIGNRFWSEIDCIEDYHSIVAYRKRP